MDAQQLEGKLVEDVEKAWAAYMAEEDPVKSSKHEKLWREAKEELNSFRRQQVAGGEDPKQAARFDLHGVRQAAGGVPYGRHCPGPCHQGWQRP